MTSLTQFPFRAKSTEIDRLNRQTGCEGKGRSGRQKIAITGSEQQIVGYSFNG